MYQTFKQVRKQEETGLLIVNHNSTNIHFDAKNFEKQIYDEVGLDPVPGWDILKIWLGLKRKLDFDEERPQYRAQDIWLEGEKISLLQQNEISTIDLLKQDKKRFLRFSGDFLFIAGSRQDTGYHELRMVHAIPERMIVCDKNDLTSREVLDDWLDTIRLGRSDVNKLTETESYEMLPPLGRKRRTSPEPPRRAYFDKGGEEIRGRRRC